MYLFIHLLMLFILGVLHVTFACLVPADSEEGTAPLELELWMVVNHYGDDRYSAKASSLVLSFGFLFLRHTPDCKVLGSNCPVSDSPGADLLFTAALYLLY